MLIREQGDCKRDNWKGQALKARERVSEKEKDRMRERKQLRESERA